jgi:hypothetical protein
MSSCSSSGLSKIAGKLKDLRFECREDLVEIGVTGYAAGKAG